MLAEVTDIQIFPRRLGNQLRGAKPAAVLPDVLAQLVNDLGVIIPRDVILLPLLRCFCSLAEPPRLHFVTRVLWFVA